ncbi:MAG TPA: pitrilysin family protein [Gemmatimonadaceae bacterium]|nr:pitrilysin family protein [Gemmatimonadaceae bacterium]
MRIPMLLAAGALALALPPAAVAQEKQAPPPVGTPKDFRLPTPTVVTLPNGMEVVMVPFGTTPKATVRLTVRTGNANEAANETWLADVTGDMLREGAGARDAERLAADVAAMGGMLGVGVSANETTIGSDVLAEHAANAVRLVADVARRPTFPGEALDRVKANRARQLAIALSQPQPQAQRKFAALVYGDHPYARIFPTEAMLKGYTLEQVKGFHARNFGAARARLYVAGVFDRAAVERAAREAFGDWEKGAAPLAIPEPPPARRQFALVNRPGAVQSTLMLGLPVADPSSPDWVRLAVTNALLGGSFGSRITTNIREQKGYTYSPFSTVDAEKDAAVWYEAADVTTNVTGASLKEILYEVNRLRDSAPPSEELRGVQNNMAGIFTLQNASRAGVVGQLSFVALHGLGDDYLSTYVRRVLAVTPADVQRTARTYLDPARMSLVVVGDETQVREQVQPYVPVVP